MPKPYFMLKVCFCKFDSFLVALIIDGHGEACQSPFSSVMDGVNLLGCRGVFPFISQLT